MAALDAYLATASCAELMAYVALAAVSIGAGPFGIANLIDHVLVARAGGR